MDEKTKLKIRAAILSTFDTYPRLSVSMVASHVRPYHPQWKQVFEAMIQDGTVTRELILKGNNRPVVVHYITPQTPVTQPHAAAS